VQVHTSSGCTLCWGRPPLLLLLLGLLLLAAAGAVPAALLVPAASAALQRVHPTPWPAGWAVGLPL
jgi:hypothetical protein